MEKKTKDIIADIKNLKVQGARNVTRAALQAFAIELGASKAKTIKELYSHLQEVATTLAQVRPTEPMMRNAIDDVLRFMLMQVRLKKIDNVLMIKKIIVLHEREFLKKMEDNVEKIAQYGAQVIAEGSVVFTHCHSSTVTRILKRAHEAGREFEVIACETRPRFQGRLTAEELVRAGIKTTLIVDGGMNAFMKKADLCLVGADSITSRGDLINKIGTSTVAHIARMHDVSFYSAAELYKYSPLTAFGEREIIEERDPKEVWDKPPKKLIVRNPAFDATAARYISGYITEVGVIAPQSLFSIATEKLGIKIS